MVRREELRSMTEAWRAYLDLALGLTETSRKRATKVARKLVGKGNATAEQLQAMAEDLVNTSLANREALTRLVRFELDRALGRVGLATAEEVGELTTRVRDLEQQLRVAQAASAVAEPAPVIAPPVGSRPAPAGAGAVVAKKVAKKVPAKKVAAKKVVAPKKAPAKVAKAAPTKAAPGAAEPARPVAPRKATRKVVPPEAEL
jgi:polyhydroxyalkanoate synthesis regulator phasin